MDGALHIEPGIWVTQPATDFPPQSVPKPAQLVARMGTIPHGNSVLAEGIAEPSVGPPVLSVPGSQYIFSRFPSFDSTPFAVPPTALGIVFGGGIENIQFLVGESPVVGGQQELQENAQTAIVDATFWIERATHKVTGHGFTQLQYAQMVVLNFPIQHLLRQNPATYVNLGWPHITVATLRKSFY